MHLITPAALLLFATTALAQPVVPVNTTDVTVPGNQGLFANFGSSWNKRAHRRPSKRSHHEHVDTKRYWKVTSVWIGELTSPFVGYPLTRRRRRGGKQGE